MVALLDQERRFVTVLGNTMIGDEDAVLARLENAFDEKGHIEHLELEAKLGLYQFGHQEKPHKTKSESLLNRRSYKKFDAAISKTTFLRIQKVLDDASEVSPHQSTSSSTGDEFAVVRRRTSSTTRDDFYKPQQGSENVRVSTDEISGETIDVIQKHRIMDIDVHASIQVGSLDFRISFNNEVPSTAPGGQSKYFRRKKRTRYDFDGWAIDLTEVYPARNAEPCFEVEIEISTPFLRNKSTKKDRREFLIKFLHSVRVLSRVAVDYTDESFVPFLHILPKEEETEILGVKRTREMPETCDETYTLEVGEAVPMIGHFLQHAAKEKKLKTSDESEVPDSKSEVPDSEDTYNF